MHWVVTNSKENRHFTLDWLIAQDRAVLHQAVETEAVQYRKVTNPTERIQSTSKSSHIATESIIAIQPIYIENSGGCYNARRHNEA